MPEPHQHQLIHHWTVQAWAHCPECRATSWVCPHCGEHQSVGVADGLTLPVTGEHTCPNCSLSCSVTVIGWHPAAQLEQALAAPAAQHHQLAPQQQQQPAQPRQGSNGERRLPIRQWRRRADAALRRRLQGISAEAIGEAHRSRGLEFRYQQWNKYGLIAGSHRVYTRGELLAALDLIDRLQGGSCD